MPRSRLAADHLRDRRSQRLLERALVDRLAGFMGSVRRDQPVRTRQAADMAGGDVIGAGSHGFHSPHPL